MKKRFFILLLFLLPLFVLAQEQFLVYSVKGEVALSNKNNEKLKSGNLCSANSVIAVPGDGAITFIGKEGGLFSITKTGSHSLINYRDSCIKPKNFLANYTLYIWEQVKKERDAKGSNRKAFMRRIDAVIRDGLNIWISPVFDTINYTGSSGDFPISWKCYCEEPKFEFTLYKTYGTGKPFYVFTTLRQKISIREITPQLGQDSSYYWGVRLPGEEDEMLQVFNYVSAKEYDSLLQIIKDMKPAFEGPAEEAYRIAFMLEDAHYFDNAYQYYIKAATLDNKNPLYIYTLISFKKNYEIK